MSYEMESCQDLLTSGSCSLASNQTSQNPCENLLSQILAQNRQLPTFLLHATISILFFCTGTLPILLDKVSPTNLEFAKIIDHKQSKAYAENRGGRTAISFESDPYRKQFLRAMHLCILVRCHVHNPEFPLVTEQNFLYCLLLSSRYYHHLPFKKYYHHQKLSADNHMYSSQ